MITEDGLFDGTIATGFEEYYIEPTSRYLGGKEDTSPAYHTIAYRASDVTTPPHPRRCPSHELHRGGNLRDSFYRLVYTKTIYIASYLHDTRKTESAFSTITSVDTHVYVCVHKIFYRTTDFSNDTARAFYERLRDNEVRDNGAFYSKETKSTVTDNHRILEELERYEMFI